MMNTLAANPLSGASPRLAHVLLGLLCLLASTGPVEPREDPFLDPSTRLVLVCWEAIHKDRATDSRLRHCRNKPWLALREGDVQILREQRGLPAPDCRKLAEVARQAGLSAEREALSRLERLAPGRLDEIRQQIPSLQHGGDLSKEVSRAYLELSEREAQSLERVGEAGGRDWVKEVLDHLDPSIKTEGRLFRRILLAPLSPFVYGWMGQHIWREYYGPKTPEFERYLVYTPSQAQDSLLPEGEDSSETHLLERYAPILAQEIPSETSYPSTDDLIGRLRWQQQPDGKLELLPDFRRPAVYAHFQWRRIGRDDLLQLIYTHWYAEHPPLKLADAEAGHLEGLTLRITLDKGGRPLVYETVYDCGCYHRMYVSSALENLARKKFGAPLSGKTYAIEKKVPFKIDLVVLDALPTPREGERPILFCWGAYHLPGKVAVGEIGDFLKGTSLGEKPYQLLPYRELESLEWNGVPVGGFDERGLLWGAGRAEGVLLSPSGILDAGHPRQRSTQLIHFDQEDFDDPDLFTEHLRWPGVPD